MEAALGNEETKQKTRNGNYSLSRPFSPPDHSGSEKKNKNKK